MAFKHFKWLQKGDPTIGGKPGFLNQHIACRTFLMHQDLELASNDEWKNKWTARTNGTGSNKTNKM